MQTNIDLDFFTEKALATKLGHPTMFWLDVFFKESCDNGLDAAEAAGVAPKITVVVDEQGVEITDNGPGIPATTVKAASTTLVASPPRPPTRPLTVALRATH